MGFASNCFMHLRERKLQCIAQHADRGAEHAFLPWPGPRHVIDKGQIVYTSTIEDLKANDNIRQRYLAF
jgi:ABC-type branched-subunit amino acid transport system ATPase component